MRRRIPLRAPGAAAVDQLNQPGLRRGAPAPV